MNLLDIFEGREPHQQAIDRLEQRRIADLEARMDDCARRGDATGFRKAKEERDSYHTIKTNEAELDEKLKGLPTKKLGSARDLGKSVKKFRAQRGLDEGEMKRAMEKDAERMSLEKFVAKYGDEGWIIEFWNDINGPLDEAGIGHDIVNKAEKMARATPPTKAGAVASTVKNAAKWLAGKGGPGKEGPTYEGAEDIEDRGEYDQEGDMVKDNLHTIRREAEELERILSDDENVPEWVQDKLAQVKGMITSASEYMQTQRERDHEEHTGDEGVTIAEWKKEGEWKEIPKSKSGKPVDPRGEVTHLSDVARRETERKLAQKKNSEKVEEESKKDLAAALMLKKAHAAFPLAKDDAEALALWIADKEQRDVNRLERENEQEEEMIARIADQIQSKDLDEHGGGGGGPREWHSYIRSHRADEGWSDAIVARRTGRPRTPYSVYIKGRKWKDFENEDHAENVANKLRAKFEREGKDPNVITIAPTDYDKSLKEGNVDPQFINVKATQLLARAAQTFKSDNVAEILAPLMKEYGLSLQQIDSMIPGGLRKAAGDLGLSMKEAANPAQQAAIAIAMKKAHKKPKHVDEGQDQVDPIILRALERLQPGLEGSQLYSAAKEALALEFGLMKAKGDATFVHYLNWLRDLYTNRQGIAEHGGGVNSMKQYIAWRKSANKERGITKKQPVGKMAPQGRAVPKGTVHGKLDQSRGVIPTSSFHEDEMTEADREVENTIRKLMAPAYEEETGGMFGYTLEKKAPTMAALREKFHDDLNAILTQASPRVLAKAAQELKDMYGQVAEGMTDFQKRRQHERDVDAGKPVARQRPSKQTDYQKRRAEQKRQDELGEEKTRLDPKCWKGKKIGTPKTKMKGGVRVNNCVPAESVEEEAKKGLYYYVNKRKKAGTSRDKDDPRAPSAQDWKDAAKTAKKESVEEEWSEKYKRSIDCSHPKGFSQKAHCAGRKKNEGMFSTLGEDQDTSGVESAIIRRIMVAHKDWLIKFGPQKVMQAAEEVAYNVGDVDEIGTSDVSAYVHEVGQILGA